MSRRNDLVRSVTVTAVALTALVLTTLPALGRAPDGGQASAKAQTTEVQILALNDFHGNLEPISSTSSSGRIGATPAGGAEFLATHVDALRATNPNTLFVSAGDLIGASPLLSALFHDEPTIEAFNLMGLDYNGVGNHEFDEGVAELLRMQYGGCHPVDGCQDGDGFAGASFQMLAANVKYKSSGETILPPYAIHHFQGIKVGIIGMTLEGTPSIVSPGGISHVDFLDEAETVNALVPVLQRQGIRTIVVLLHEGGFVSGSLNESTINQCNNPTGPIPPIVDAMDDEVDLVITGHTNWAVNCLIDGKIVTGAAAFGRLITDIDMTISRATKNPIEIKVNNRIVTRDVLKAPALTNLINRYNAIADPLKNRVIGTITGNILRLNNTAGESQLGDVIADAQLLATASPTTGSAVVAFMNPGGIRADLLFAPSGSESPGEVTYGEAFTVQPFGNSLVTMTLTGAQIDTLLEQQFAGCVLGTTNNRILQVSAGFTYTWSSSASACNKVDPTSIKIGGSTVNPTSTYRVTVNSFLADGGDSFPILIQGSDRLGGAVDTDALEAYFLANSPVAPGPQNRITMAP